MVKIKIIPYDAKNREKLLKGQFKEAIGLIIDSEINITPEEFLIHTIFSEQKNFPGFKTYQDLKLKLPSRIDRMKDYFSLDGASPIANFHGRDNVPIDITSSAGVGASISVANRVFGLTEADWVKTEEDVTKTLDYYFVSDGNSIIEIEAKGAITQKNEISSSISQHKSDIVKKKEKSQSFSGSFKIGIVSSFPYEDNSILCRLVDPPVSSDYESPKKFRLISRLRFYCNLIRTIKRGQIAIALANKIQAIVSCKDFWSLNNDFLRNRDDQEILIDKTQFQTKTIVDDFKYVGEIIPLSDETFFFSGITVEIIELLIKQDFQRILDYFYCPLNNACT